MIMRRCQVCGSEWFSADETGDWICDKCGAIIGKELNEKAEENEK